MKAEEYISSLLSPELKAALPVVVEQNLLVTAVIGVVLALFILVKILGSSQSPKKNIKRRGQ